MENKAVYTGFWKERETLARENNIDLEEMTFDFLENEDMFSREEKDTWAAMLEKANKAVNKTIAKTVVNRYTIRDFLHGDCNIFAQYLHEKYGYDVEAVLEGPDGEDKKPQLVHMYCTYTPEPGRKVYVDVRGKCDDYLLFMEEFYNAGLWDDSCSYTRRYDSFPEIFKASEEDSWRLDAAKTTDDIYKYYDLCAGESHR